MTEDLKIDRPIAGTIRKSYRSHVPQKSVGEFLDALDTVLALDGVEAVVWNQYTPYFNDGEECLFSVQDFRVVLEGDEEDTDGYRDYDIGRTTYELFDYSDKYPKPTYPTAQYESPERAAQNLAYSDAYKLWSGEDNKVYEVNGRDTKPISDALRAINPSEFEDVLLTNFGDHATVTATSAGFSVDEYDHE